MTRAIMGSGMQAAEHAQRRASMNQSEASAEVARERGVAEMIRRELSSPSFWKQASSEAIADRMTVASELALKHNDASQAFMVGADRIRNQYGINIEDINRDHPASSIQRHQALRDALDDYLASQRINSEAQGTEAGAEKVRVPDASVTAEETVQELEQAAAAAKQDEQANLARAGEAESETQQDAKNTQADEAKETTRHSDGPTDRPANEPSAAPAAVLSVWKEKGGKDADFPMAPTTRNPQAAMKNRQRVLAAAGAQRGQRQELSR